MLSPYRCSCISLVSGLRSEYSSSSIGSSCALCSARRAAYQKRARGPCFSPGDGPLASCVVARGLGYAWAWECREDRASSAPYCIACLALSRPYRLSRRAQSPSWAHSLFYVPVFQDLEYHRVWHPRTSVFVFSCIIGCLAMTQLGIAYAECVGFVWLQLCRGDVHTSPVEWRMRSF